ncbi:MAG TPA: MraY family glycosyltransferase [Syntrophorhabdales bacterium]|nr:MraY family glycosyltransferase [Syntrophorhabdales bacterium]
MIYLSSLLLSFFITVVLIPLFSRAALSYNIGLDVPDARKIHGTPIPRVGGVAVGLGVFMSTVLWLPPSSFIRAYAFGAAIVVIFGLLDDLKGLGFKAKFLAQLAAAIIVVWYGDVRIRSLGSLLPDGFLLPEAVAIPLTILAIVGVTNAVNLADGLDGLAGGICLLSFSCLAYLAYAGEDTTICLLTLALVGSIMGFLRYNTHPAELFLGDTGSQFLGFSAITVSLGLTQQQSTALSPLLPLLILGFPVLDTLAVMAQRLAEGRPLFSPDKNHFHHRLMGLGFHHSESVVAIYCLQCVLVVGAYFLRFHEDWLILSVYLALSAVIIGGFHTADRAGWRLGRYDFLEYLVKGRVKRMRDEGVFIRVSFRAIRFGIPLLLLATSFVPSKVPTYIGLLSIALLCMLGGVRLFKRSWTRVGLMFALYLFIPLIVYLSAETERSMPDAANLLYGAAFIVLVVASVLTLKLTRRQRGFKSTPMDFLILFMALVFPYLLGAYLPVKGLPIVVAKTIMFFFAYEVVMGELRGRLDGLALISAPALLVVAIRGISGW